MKNPIQFTAKILLLSLFVGSLQGCFLFRTRDSISEKVEPPKKRVFSPLVGNPEAFTPSIMLMGGFHTREGSGVSPRNERVQSMFNQVMADKYKHFVREETTPWGNEGMYPFPFVLGPVSKTGAQDEYARSRVINQVASELPTQNSNSTNKPFDNYKNLVLHVTGVNDPNHDSYCLNFLGLPEQICENREHSNAIFRVAISESMILLHNIELILVGTQKDPVSELPMIPAQVKADLADWAENILPSFRGDGNFRIVLMSQVDLTDSQNMTQESYNWFQNFIKQNEEVIALFHAGKSHNRNREIHRIPRYKFPNTPNQVRLQDFHVYEPPSFGYRDEVNPNPETCSSQPSSPNYYCYGYSEIYVSRGEITIKEQVFTRNQNQWVLNQGKVFSGTGESTPSARQGIDLKLCDPALKSGGSSTSNGCDFGASPSISN